MYAADDGTSGRNTMNALCAAPPSDDDIDDDADDDYDEDEDEDGSDEDDEDDEEEETWQVANLRAIRRMPLLDFGGACSYTGAGLS
jgi:hypothetical protein